MQNQSPITVVIVRSANYLKRHSRVFAQDGCLSMTAKERSIRQEQIKLCGDQMARSQTWAQYEAALAKARQLGAYPYNSDISAVAHADLFAD